MNKTLKPIFKLFLLIIPILSLTSCIPLKDIKYIQPDEKLKLDENGMISFNRPEYRLQINDLINIQISVRDPQQLNMLQTYISNNQQNNTAGGSGSNQVRGSAVRLREDGNIELPRVGKIYIIGLTIQEAREKIQEEFYKIFEPESAFIDVNIQGINFTLVGEAGSGNYFVSQYDFNLLEAFAMAGNLTPVADRKHIQIIRTTPDGTQRAELDITKESVMNSEYFWLQPNDIIIVNPRRQKQWGIGLNPVQTVSTVFGAVASIIGIYFFFRNL